MATGLNLTGEVIRVGIPIARNAIEQAPAIINGTRAVLQTINSDENRERVQQIAGVGTRVAQGAGTVASQAPELVSQGSRLAGSLIHAANETAPLIVDGIQEFTDQIPLITGFASAYAEVNAEQTQKVSNNGTKIFLVFSTMSFSVSRLSKHSTLLFSVISSAGMLTILI